MSGHSKWAQIKRQKGVADARRGQVFTRLAREITLAAKMGGGPSVDGNFRLRLAVERARASNMPMDNIERAIKRATGEGGSGALEEIVYEGYGPGGTAILVETVTDNRQRTVAEIRNAFNRGGGNMGEAGSVAWVFDQKGSITIELAGKDEDELALQVIDAGAEDFRSDPELGTMEVFTAPEDLEKVRQALEGLGLPAQSAEVLMIAKNTVTLDEKTAQQTLRLLDRLEELDDVQKVYSNADFPDEVLASIA